MKPILQISLDLIDRAEAMATAHMALRAGVDWLEAGTPFILAEGLHGVAALRKEFPGVPIVADLKTMDGGYLEAEMMAKAGATHVVVMARAHEETIKCVVKAGKDYGISVMGDNLACPNMVDGAKWLEDLGCDIVVHHIGYDERRGIASAGRRMPSPLDQLREVVAAVSVPVHRTGGALAGIWRAACRAGRAVDHRGRLVQDGRRRRGRAAANDLRKGACLWRYRGGKEKMTQRDLK
jgi:3-hexulose-6-phosphate synthase